ncbi:hypothetical protein K438DRAFT_2092496 [Mycena galopus ATCC 62051]|nr:hypothetical protein K438DRAFT_2092496 [Mycena galopus ATCC 62051]
MEYVRSGPLVTVAVATRRIPMHFKHTPASWRTVSRTGSITTPCQSLCTILDCKCRHDGEECPSPNGRHVVLIGLPGRSIGHGEEAQLLEMAWILLCCHKMSMQKGRRGGVRVTKTPTMYTHEPHKSEVLSISADGRRGTTTSAIVHTHPEIPAYYQEDAATNAALEAEEFSYSMGDMTLPVEEQEPDDLPPSAAKRKRYDNSDYPLQTWTNYQDEYLDEMLRLEGRGDPASHLECLSCGTMDPTFRCAQQLCHGAGMFCAKCIVQKHQFLPTHWVEEWNGEYFERRALYDLGLVVQLGHPPGYSCPTSNPAHKDFVLIDITGIQHIRLHFCECDARITHRQQLMRVQWWPATVKDPQTCATFAVGRFLHMTLHIVRQYRRGHSLSGIKGTAQGELALRCRACPQDGRNLPDGWDKINWDEMPDDLRYKYFLFLSQDCNFRLINRDVSTAAKDPIIGDGLGYFVNHAKYTEFLRAHVSEEEISSCSGFQAMFLANKKRVKGLRTTGVGGVTCARHNMWRPNGIGDLQLGERQWRTHGETVEQNWEFTNGAAASTKMMGLGTRHATLEDLFGFHNWRRLVSWRGIFTKRMKENVTEGQVHRDAFNAFNAALEEQVPDMVGKWKEWVHDWESRQHTDGTESPFEVKEKGKANGNEVTTMKEIRLRLAQEELIRNGEGVEVEREDTPSTFMMMGLEIEESQRHLAIDVKAISNPTNAQALDFLQRRTTITKRIRAFRKLQRAYMPHVRKFLTASQQSLWDSEADREAEAIRLFLPSDITDKTKREKACAEGLPDVEATLREGEAHEALETLRQGLRIRTMTNRYRIRNATGQRALTRGQGVLRQNNVRIHKAKLRYRYARNALSRLRGNGEWERVLRVLDDNDVRALNERALTNEERAQRKAVHDLHDVEEGGIQTYGTAALGESRRTLSWIWYTAKAGEPTEQELVEALRVEWCKAYARMRRWHEDVVLVEEEMRRTIQYGYWEAGQWLERSLAREGVVDDVLQEGLKAYALEQVHREAKTCDELKRNWAPWRERGCLFLERATPASEVVVAPEEDGRELDEEDEEEDESAPDYEDEEEDVLE